mmetsp:Transcript_24930/g.63629  ORF Transcript_24930/g.63629 Transcript_24930/m.63629 type:complete len:413 (+) Transcript_24930:39-1277(+)
MWFPCGLRLRGESLSVFCAPPTRRVDDIDEDPDPVINCGCGPRKSYGYVGGQLLDLRLARTTTSSSSVPLPRSQSTSPARTVSSPPAPLQKRTCSADPRPPAARPAGDCRRPSCPAPARRPTGGAAGALPRAASAGGAGTRRPGAVDSSASRQGTSSTSRSRSAQSSSSSSSTASSESGDDDSSSNCLTTEKHHQQARVVATQRLRFSIAKLEEHPWIEVASATSNPLKLAAMSYGLDNAVAVLTWRKRYLRIVQSLDGTSLEIHFCKVNDPADDALLGTKEMLGLVSMISLTAKEEELWHAHLTEAEHVSHSKEHLAVHEIQSIGHSRMAMRQQADVTFEIAMSGPVEGFDENTIVLRAPDRFGKTVWMEHLGIVVSAAKLSGSHAAQAVQSRPASMHRMSRARSLSRTSG